MEEVNIFILGSGMVAGPCIDYLLRSIKNRLTLACRTLSTAQQLAKGRPRVSCISIDVTSFKELSEQVKGHDLVISLVPFVHHANVIRAAIKGKTNVVTTSYISAEMRALEKEATAAGIVVLNEVGVDPGVDHLYAVQMIYKFHREGGKVREFQSFCGGLPAPECSDSPLRFKFSWSPRGALLSQYNSASFLQDGKEKHIPREDLMAQAQPRSVREGYSFVAYPNRDSIPFRDFYNIPEARKVVRGSLRYEGNPAFVGALIKLGWVDTKPKTWLRPGMTWIQIQAARVGSKSDAEASIIGRIGELLRFSDASERERIISGLRWIGLFSHEAASIHGTLLDTLCERLEQLMTFQPGKRDLVMLQHTSL